MKPTVYARLALRVLQYKFSGRRAPAIVSFIVTSRCPHGCAMCGTGTSPRDEISTKAALDLINRLADAGMVKMIFTGGEPFLREDLSLLVRHCVKRGVSVSVNTSGFGIESHPHLLEHLNPLRMSLDGPEEINDRIRYPGAFRDVIRGIRFCRERKIPIALMCTINHVNVGHLRETSEIARDQGVPIAFHPCGETLLRGKESNPLMLTPDRIRHAMEELITLKTENPFIANSHFGLGLYTDRRGTRAIQCLAGRLFCRVEPDGRVKGCGWDRWSPQDLNLLDMPVPDALGRIPGMHCDLCLCMSRFELNAVVDNMARGVFQHLVHSPLGKGMKDLW
ncbi:radical SAM protein [Thermodesulfobacteriota bacterium]